MIDNALTFLREIYGSLWGRIFRSSWAYKAILRLIGYESKMALLTAQKQEDSLFIKQAGKAYKIPVLLQVPLSKIHSGDLLVDGSWTLGQGILGQRYVNKKTVVQIKLPYDCTGLSSECTGNKVLLRDVDFVIRDSYFVLYTDPLKLFNYVHMKNAEPHYDIWMYGVSSEASLDNYSVLTGADLNKIPHSGEVIWDSYVRGLTESKLNQIISNGLGVDLAKLSGYVRKIWNEDGFNYIDIEGSVHAAPEQYPALVVPGEYIKVLQVLFDTHKMYTRGSLPQYSEVSEVALPVSPGRFVKIPNYMVPVVDYVIEADESSSESDTHIRYLELKTTTGSFTESVEEVITKFQVQSVVESVSSVNALQYVMEQVFRNDFIILKFKHIKDELVPAIQAIAQAINSTKPLYACVAVTIETDSINDCILSITGDSEIEGPGNPDTEAVHLDCAPGAHKVDFE